MGASSCAGWPVSRRDVPSLCATLSSEDLGRLRLVQFPNGKGPVLRLANSPGPQRPCHDLSLIPPATAKSHDVAFLYGFEEGWHAVASHAKGIGFGMAWDRRVFKW